MSEMYVDPDQQRDEAPEPVDEVAGGLPAVGAEVPEADAIDQHRTVHDERREFPPAIPYDADPADAADQERSVDFGDDDYR
ncbi:hypothetical protein Sru01_52390 [Sphaerisporangium rufum]|uniref:Uncharacterized protein n=1 Tax=Sphaerisporangium rufum TaxID=1381558 RepID=A0A919RAC6_9ACTN|nr:hypothetical protein [Sphaerisporangium rufum]GII80257.1 hypothetical protein Sru01_52390 [Sphaerisporangium rufum]